MNVKDLMKDRGSILLHILNLCEENNIDVKQMAIIARINDDDIYLYCICKDKIKNKYFSNIDYIYVDTICCGKCKCYILSYKEFHKKLIHNDKMYLSIYKDSNIILDLSNKYKSMIESAKSKIKWWPIFKNIFY